MYYSQSSFQSVASRAILDHYSKRLIAPEHYESFMSRVLILPATRRCGKTSAILNLMNPAKDYLFYANMAQVDYVRKFFRVPDANMFSVGSITIDKFRGRKLDTKDSVFWFDEVSPGKAIDIVWNLFPAIQIPKLVVITGTF